MNANTPEERARKRANDFVGLMWHIASYVIVVPFMFLLDWYLEDGIQWAFWVAIPWAVGLLFHVIAYFIDERLTDRAYERFLAQEKAKLKDKKA
ncbi:MAG: 2TM domain-containing protein [Demequinaceae bacterium]|nr:2TM domain-containing protein [Demequinaceae bacterium]